MKKILMAAAFAFVSVCASAQVYLGGGLGFSSEKEAHFENVDVDAKTTFWIQPELGYKLDDKMAVGIELGYGHSKKGDFKSDAFTINPYFRYTFAKWDRISLFADLGFFYEHAKNSVEEQEGNVTVTVEEKENTWGIGITPGVQFDINQNWALIAKVGWFGYSSTKPDGDGIKASSDFGFNVDGSDLSLGIYYNF